MVWLKRIATPRRKHKGLGPQGNACLKGGNQLLYNKGISEEWPIQPKECQICRIARAERCIHLYFSDKDPGVVNRNKNHVTDDVYW
ncbi:hypothetical protein Y1Q_0020031 [Alligator mississippiensis]|uniref:Uncharacterized protein n=1 Tax=Alligator mississippiensis TaxID=8496 RepID=A0A151LYT6_ALLMI|nr:hypothetical protein Y1Q_0020031 [Alligator mississippiensis]